MDTKSGPSLTIGIISHKQISYVERLLSSINSNPPKNSFQVVILENVYSQPKIDFSKFNFQVTYIKNLFPLSLAENINIIFDRMSRMSDYFCIPNPDIIFEQELFSGLFAAMATYEIDIISPLIIGSYGEIQDSFRPIPNPIEIILRYLKFIKHKYQIQDIPEISYPDWIGAMFMLMPSSVFNTVGGFDTQYKLYFEDVDFCYRAKKKGASIGVTKKFRIIHDAQRASHHNFIYLFKHVNSVIKFFGSIERIK